MNIRRKHAIKFDIRHIIQISIIRKSLNVALYEDNRSENLNNKEWKFAEIIVTVQPIKEATELMSGQIYPTLSLSYTK